MSRKNKNLFLEPELPLTDVDLPHYSGTWYEIALIPQYFETNCVRAKAEYMWIPGTNSLNIINTCTLKNGSHYQIKGKAFAIGKGQLYVDFGFPSQDQVEKYIGNYWILEIDPYYRWVLIGSPSRSSAWILSRSPFMKKELLQNLLEKLFFVHGYDISNIKIR